MVNHQYREVPWGPAELRQNGPCTEEGSLPTECPWQDRGSPEHSVLKRPLFFHSSRKDEVETQVPVTQQPSLSSQGENIAREGIKPNSSSWKSIYYPVFGSTNLGFTKQMIWTQ